MAKSLSDMTQAELWALFPIQLRPHNPLWSTWYEAEVQELTQILGTSVIERINHIGSTAVNGLIAKPIVDILLEISKDVSNELIISALEKSSWIYQGTPTIDSWDRMMFLKGYTPSGFAEKVFHLHVRSRGDWNELYFRDYLLLHSEVQEMYGDLKFRLKNIYEHDRDAYTLAKGPFIEKFTALAKEEFCGRYR